MNAVVTSKEAIMKVCRKIVAEKGLTALNVRMVAKECNIALGTLYNYYSDKNELVIATVESVWKDIFYMKNEYEGSFSFPDYIVHIFHCIQEGVAKYPGFFSAHSVSIAKSKQDEAKSIMEKYFEHMKQKMTEVLHSDAAVDFSKFSGVFTESDLIDFVLNNILILLVEKKENCTTLVELVRRAIYR